MTKWEMSSCNRSKNVHRNFCRSSNNMAKCEIFSFTRSRLVYMEFSIDLLITWKNIRCSLLTDPDICMEIYLVFSSNIKIVRCFVISDPDVHVNFHIPSIYMAKCKMFSCNWSRRVHGNFHRFYQQHGKMWDVQLQNIQTCAYKFP